MVNYTEKLLCVEVLEKISRMQRFLRSEPDASRRRGAEIVGVFLEALDAILDSTRSTMGRLSEEISLAEWERLSIVRRLSDIFRSVDMLHLSLQFVYGTWVRPETHVFLRNALRFIPEGRRPERVNAILSNMYSFLETDLSSYFEEVLSLGSVHVDFQNQNPSVLLPKIERDNPLNWAILVHECGHADSQGIADILELPEIVPSQANASTKDKEALRSWVEEIYCDLFATKILGPAYLASFATFALVAAGAGGSEAVSETHPPSIARISIIKEVLEKNNLKVGLTEPISDCSDLSSLFFNVLEERTKLDRQYPLPPMQQFELQVPLGEFVDTICEKVDEIISLNQQLTLKDFARIGGLAQRLSKGILIGSYQNPRLTKETKAKFLECLECKIDPKKLNEAKSVVEESSVLLWEIVNAGWLHKVESIYPEAFKLFFGSDDTPIKEKLTGWGKELEGIDRLLLKSIEASEIQRLMEEVQ